MPETDVFPLSPDYTIPEQWDEGVLRSRTMGRKDHQRLVAPPQRLFRLFFRERPTTEKETLLTWYRKFEHTWFRFDYATYLVESGSYLSRSFPVIWGAAPRMELISNEAWDMEVELVEAVERALPVANYPTFTAGHPYAAVTEYRDSGSDRYILYGGYGFRTVSAGSATIELDGVSLGTAPITKTDVPLGLHQVKVVGGAGGSASLEVLI